MANRKKQPKSNSEFNLAEWISHNPLISLIIMGTAVVGATFSAVQFWHAQEIKIMKERHANEMEEIKRGLVRRELGKDAYFDVKQLCENDITNVGSSMKAYGHAPFYVSDKVKENNIWEYRPGNAVEFVDEISGGRNKLMATLNSISSGKPDTGHISKVHIWKGKNELLVENDAPIKRLFPYITVSSFSSADVIKRMDELSKYWVSKLRSTVRSNPVIRMVVELFPRFTIMVDKLEEDLKKSMRIVLENDFPGSMLTGHLILDLSYPVFYPEIKYDLVKLQKIGKVYYKRSLGVMKDIKISGKTGLHKYNFIHETFLIHTSNDSHFITVSVPYSVDWEEREYLNHVAIWLKNFKIVPEEGCNALIPSRTQN
jgi:hypothetical protein